MSPPRSPSPLPAVKLSDLLARVENDYDLLRELIDIFKQDFPRHLESLRASIAHENLQAVMDSSHSLKGMLSALSVQRAASTASRIEQMARRGQRSGLAQTLADLESEVAELMTELTGYSQGLKS